MIEIGSLVREVGWGYGIVTEIRITNYDGKQAYRIRWFEGGYNILSAWQFEVIG